MRSRVVEEAVAAAEVAWIREALQRIGKSQADLARFLGRDPSIVSKLLSGQRQLKASEALRIRQWLEAGAPTTIDTPTAQLESKDAFPFQPREPVRDASGVRDLPIYGSVKGGIGGDAVDLASPVEWAVRPMNLAGVTKAFGLYVVGTSMVPRFSPGEMVEVHPGRPLTRGCGVVVVFHDNSAILATFVRSTDRFVEVEKHNPASKRQIDRAEIQGVYRVVGWQDGR